MHYTCRTTIIYSLPKDLCRRPIYFSTSGLGSTSSWTHPAQAEPSTTERVHVLRPLILDSIRLLRNAVLPVSKLWQLKTCHVLNRIIAKHHLHKCRMSSKDHVYNVIATLKRGHPALHAAWGTCVWKSFDLPLAVYLIRRYDGRILKCKVDPFTRHSNFSPFWRMGTNKTQACAITRWGEGWYLFQVKLITSFSVVAVWPTFRGEARSARFDQNISTLDLRIRFLKGMACHNTVTLVQVVLKIWRGF